MELALYIGNKNYSSWSMRPWVLMKQSGISFTEKLVRFDSFAADSNFKKSISQISRVGKVPVLVASSSSEVCTIWDSLAICEYLAETYPDLSLWPSDKFNRSFARSLCAEMHSGFTALRTHCPMNIEAKLPEIGHRLIQEQAEVRSDLNRFIQICEELLSKHNGPMLFGKFSIADAFFAPVCMRIHTYALPVTSAVQTYISYVIALPSVATWIKEAMLERDFREFEEITRNQKPHP